ncbi:MAG TPA: MarR family transcriptional regulator [Acidobacteriota bacterium]|nr:MarR family transcriptional regulator [Acidobacteriota bacterium]
MARHSDSTYYRLLETLKRAGGGLTVKDLCRRLSLSPMAVHRQLNLLEGDELIYSRKVKQNTGRPSMAYYLTEKGHECFERDYANLAIDLLVTIRAEDGKSKIDHLLEIRKQERLRRAQERVCGKTLEAKVHEVTRLMNEDGYMAEWEKVGPDRYLIRLMNCAVHQVAKRFPQMCVSEQDFISEFLEARVSRQHYILQKDDFCSYLVEAYPQDQ